jgi:RNAse (barnase) inhibitor barstar
VCHEKGARITEIEELKVSLVQANSLLEAEKKLVTALWERLLEMEDKLEFEQKLFGKEKEELDKRIDENITKLDQVSKEFEQVQLHHGQESQELHCCIEETLSCIAKMETNLKLEQELFEKERLELLGQIQE